MNVPGWAVGMDCVALVDARMDTCQSGLAGALGADPPRCRDGGRVLGSSPAGPGVGPPVAARLDAGDCGLSRCRQGITSPSLMVGAVWRSGRFLRRKSPPRAAIRAPREGLTAIGGFHRFCFNPDALQVAAQSRAA